MLYFNWCNYIDQEVRTPDSNTVVTPEHILAFCTGADWILVLGFCKTATMMFTSEVLATSSTCSLVMYFLYCHEEFSEFKFYMVESHISNGGFGLV